MLSLNNKIYLIHICNFKTIVFQPNNFYKISTLTIFIDQIGAHTIGQARCTNFRARIYNESNINRSFDQLRKKNCPISSRNNSLAPLDLQTPTIFDNNYYKNLISLKGLLHSDQQLYNNGSTDSQVRIYATNPSKFISDFVTGMIKMGDVSPLIGSKGEIRKNCRKVN